MRRVDLHLHTRFSDGSWTPDELVRAAAQRELAAIAVTDHDTLDGVPAMLAAGASHGIEVLPGVEITCRVETREIHLLGYFPGDTWKDSGLKAVLDHSRQVREKRIGEIVARLNEHGIALTTPQVLACSECGTLGRPHVAMAMVQAGIVRNVDEAFERFLRRGKPGFVERYRMTVAEAIGHVRRAGGVAVLAHPALNGVDDHIPDMTQQGLDGLEAWHSRHTPSQIERYHKLAKQHGLLVTGGSDCHGTGRGKELLGTVPVPYECVRAIYDRHP